MNHPGPVVITGASRGIGREAALRFARGGSDLVLTFRQGRDAAAELAEECRRLGAGQVWPRELDLADPAGIEGFARELLARHGRIRVLVNNAGMIVWGPLPGQSREDVLRQIATNLTGPILLTRALLPHVGTVLNVASDLSRFGMADLTVYCATKFGLRGFTQAFAAEHPEVRVLCVNPDRTATGMNDFQGRDPAVAGEVIWKAAEGFYDVPNGGDVDVWEVL
ncbi:MAG TPA: SDR family oxidoreductase [Thermoanaerobaculia bacterium]|nr:SDR family oxidoreductase [Thermoanaerobaculia bacterium]